MPDKNNEWEAAAAFNPSVVQDDNGIYHMVYRAMSLPQKYRDKNLPVSVIGYARSEDGIHFEERRPFITPEKDWEIFGCEDPRVTRLGDKYYIFYTALSAFPFNADCIKIAVAITRDFKTIEEKRNCSGFSKTLDVLSIESELASARAALPLSYANVYRRKISRNVNRRYGSSAGKNLFSDVRSRI